MKRLHTFLLIVLLPVSIFSQTSVSGNQSGTWSKAGSPYLVIGDIVVASRQMLTILPGVVVKMEGNFKFTVRGKLQAVGTETDSIYFTTDNITEGWHGIRVDSSLNISHLAFCRIEYGKTSGSNFPDQHGGGLMLDNSDIIVENCLFSNNEATAEDNGMGGAIYGINTTSETQILNCKFVNNHSYGEGGAIKLTGDNGVYIDRCTFIDNTVLYGGGAICLYGCYDTQIRRSLFIGNITTYSSGGSVLIEGYSARIKFVNCTMINNAASGGDGGAVELAFSDASFTNSIIYNNHGAYSDNIYLDLGYAEVNYCNTPFPEGAEGSNNINVDAEFVDEVNNNFYLSATSPCINSGTDSLTIQDAFQEIITVVDMDSSEFYGIAPDMGCFEYSPLLGINNLIDELPNESKLYRNYPNPFNPTTTIKYSLTNKLVDHNAALNITLKIFDITGREITTLIKQEQPPGNYTVEFDAENLPSGIYFYQLKTGDFLQTKKMMLLR